ncbi:phosphatidylglycerophosphatase A [Stappia sp. MMSF_3263]|uniref:phosphatidylglycerophosphatase A family protein n=1 Tax=Stappia sp. MMSF_3263 TaxID=3046693 RepID=UPI00273F5C4C|nr:phosphatidylglycerophosphatase A [Stappia sp. MMSF_3263]
MSRLVHRVKQGLAHTLALSFGAGLSPVWPGTVGAAVGLLCAVLLRTVPPAGQVAGLVLMLMIGIWASAIVARACREDDPQCVVIDESFGAAATVLALPPEPLWWALGFVAFRFFDIVKPFPVNWVQDHVKGGTGIMLDDAAAALYAIAVLWPVSRLLAV